VPVHGLPLKSTYGGNGSFLIKLYARKVPTKPSFQEGINPFMLRRKAKVSKLYRR
jgi:hypothetical protein